MVVPHENCPPPKRGGLKTFIFLSENSDSAIFGQLLCGNEEEFWENYNNWYNYDISATLTSTFDNIQLRGS